MGGVYVCGGGVGGYGSARGGVGLVGEEAFRSRGVVPRRMHPAGGDCAAAGRRNQEYHIISFIMRHMVCCWGHLHDVRHTHMALTHDPLLCWAAGCGAVAETLDVRAARRFGEC